MNRRNIFAFGFTFVFLSLLMLTSCDDDVVPKPRAYFRIDIPEHDFILFDSNFPYTFNYADYAIINTADKENHPYWIYLDYPRFKARIYITYNDIHGNMMQMLEDAHDLAYKHISVANDIQQDLIILPENKVYGLFYKIKGTKVASPLNFYLTDSVSHFVRGSLYFNMMPQNDSLEPVINGIESDLHQLIRTFKWKNIE